MSLSTKLLRKKVLAAAVLSVAGYGFGFSAADSRAQQIRPRAVPTVTPTPKASPTAAGSVSPTPVQPVQTLESLQTKFRQRISSPDVARGRVGVKVVSLTTGKVLFENDADKYFVPASNMKNFTVATAIEKLTPDFRFVTSVYADAKPDAEGVIKGDLRIYGRGDVTISTAFKSGDYYKGVDNLVDKIVAAGVKQVSGGLVADEGYFKGNAIPQTWEWNDLQWYYGAEVSTLPVNDSAVDLKVTPARPGEPCAFSVQPQNSVVQVTNLCITTASGGTNSLQVFKAPGRNVIELSGAMPVGEKFEGYISVTHPVEIFLDLLRQRLKLRGVTIAGGSRVMPPNVTTASQMEIARLESPPLSAVAARTMKASQNLYAETLLWTLGEEIGRKSSMSGDSPTAGLGVVRAFLNAAGVPQSSVIQFDGSGLSRRNLITPSAVVALYRYMANQSKYASAWRSSLSVGGIDGTLSKRFAGSAVAGRLQGKSGTIDQVSALSGYLTTNGGEQLVISVIVNGVTEPKMRTGLIDDIVVDLANYNGKVE
jgi:D-alanyl-D-alanine carboxypeptidase/D-alanyl-D-alanine-endopeptidase (penicillin-binding protein 4)